MQSDTVSKYLEADHRRLDAIALEVGERLRERSLDEAARRFDELAQGLSRHIDAEEQVLFPAFEELTGILRGPTVVMRAEHVELRRLMDAVRASLRAQDGAGAGGALAAMLDLLAMHNKKEEHVLYPMADDALGTPEARAALVRDMREL